MPRRKPPPPLSDAQFEIMNVVWQIGKCTVAEVLEQLQQRRSVARNTVQTMMSRLEEKGWLTHTDEAGTFVYSARVPREAVQQDVLKQVLQTVFDSSAAGMLMALLQNESLTRAEANRIRQLIKEAEKRQ